MKVVEAKIINLTAVQPIRCGDSSKDVPGEQRESVATIFGPHVFLVHW